FPVIVEIGQQRGARSPDRRVDVAVDPRRHGVSRNVAVGDDLRRGAKSAPISLRAQEVRGGAYQLRPGVFRIENANSCYSDWVALPQGIKGAQMKLAKLAVTFSLSLAATSSAWAASITGHAALALAGVVALYAPMPAANKKAVAALFKGDTNFPYTAKIAVVAEKIVCRTSNVDLTARSCELTFKTSSKALKGREANELFATLAMAGIPSDGAAGSNFEGLSRLNCTLDPKVLKQKAGGGAECSYEAAK